MVSYMNKESITVNQKIVDRLWGKILLLENEFLRTGKYSETQIKEKIKKWIEEEVKCCSNQ